MTYYHDPAPADRNHPGTRWLLKGAAPPSAALRAWAAGRCAAIQAGAWWDVLEAPLVPSVQISTHLPAPARGPLLADPAATLAWWLVPRTAGPAPAWPDPARLLAVGETLWCPPADVVAGGRLWLIPPDGTGCLAQPDALATALATVTRQAA